MIAEKANIKYKPQNQVIDIVTETISDALGKYETEKIMSKKPKIDVSDGLVKY